MSFESMFSPGSLNKCTKIETLKGKQSMCIIKVMQLIKKDTDSTHLIITGYVTEIKIYTDN